MEPHNVRGLRYLELINLTTTCARRGPQFHFMLFWRKKSNEYFIIVAWSLSNWFSQTGFLPDVQLSSEGISQLISDLGLTKFLSDDKCVYTDSVFTAAYQGWTSGRYVALF